MKSGECIAQVSLELKTHRVKHITFYVKNLRFKCKHCATFCCKLGGPTLSKNDIERLKKARGCEAEFLDSIHRSLKNRASSSCTFLRFDTENGVYECTVYDYRPALCRLYPFHFERTSPNSFMLKIMPCRGISLRSGELVDEKFVFANLLNALRDLDF